MLEALHLCKVDMLEAFLTIKKNSNRFLESISEL